MKRIGIDARLYYQTGVGVYLQNLLYYLQKLPVSDIQFYVYVLDSDAGKISFTNTNFIKRITKAKWHTFDEQIEFKRVILKDSLDLMHFTYFGYPVLYDRPFIATVHDVTNLLFKTGKASTKSKITYEFKHLVYRVMLKNQIRNAKSIITPSLTVKNQLVSLFGKDKEEKITAAYEGIDYKLKNIQPKKLDSLPEKYFLYVGNFYPHKNVQFIVDSFASLPSSYKLVLRGPHDHFSKEIVEKIKKLNMTDRIILWEHYSHEEMASLYTYAKALIAPSFSEGFGLPLVEAMYFNTPVICSDIPIYREIMRNTGFYFDPHSSADFIKTVDTFLKEKKTLDYTKLKDIYSFEKMAKKTLDIYHKRLSL